MTETTFELLKAIIPSVITASAVSYTHLDVYKRQVQHRAINTPTKRLLSNHLQIYRLMFRYYYSNY